MEYSRVVALIVSAVRKFADELERQNMSGSTHTIPVVGDKDRLPESVACKTLNDVFVDANIGGMKWGILDAAESMSIKTVADADGTRISDWLCCRNIGKTRIKILTDVLTPLGVVFRP